MEPDAMGELVPGTPALYSESHCPSGLLLASLIGVPDTSSPGSPSPPVWLTLLAPSSTPTLPLWPAPWQDSWLNRHLRDCWFLWLNSLIPASALPGFRASAEPRLCFWKHPHSSSQFPGEIPLTKARFSCD